MMHTFATREEAAVFAAAMRSEGRYAEILDEGMGAIYGPLAIGGIRVILSEEAANEADDGQMFDKPFPDKPSKIEKCLDALRLLVASFVACGLITLAGLMVKIINEDPKYARLVLYPLLKYALLICFFFALMGPFMGGFTRWLRGECTSIVSHALRWVFLVLIAVFVLLLML